MTDNSKQCHDQQFKTKQNGIVLFTRKRALARKLFQVVVNFSFIKTAPAAHDTPLGALNDCFDKIVVRKR